MAQIDFTPAPAKARVWSKFQNDIFAFVADPTLGNAIVEAVAGSGKSTTILEAMSLAEGESVFLAFNRDIANELKAKGANARTFHSLCTGAVLRSRNANSVTPDKLRRIRRENFPRQVNSIYGLFAERLVGLARQMGFRIPGMADGTFEEWMNLVIHHDLSVDSADSDITEGIEMAMELLRLSNESPLVDFDDLLYFAVRDNLRLPTFDFVFVDEAQDTNRIQREILRKIMKPTSRLVAVGDPAQAIYGFRGADSESLEFIAKEFNCITLPLSITYRCASSIVSYVQTWVPHIEARVGAPEGIVKHHGTKWDASLFQPNDLVVCRRTSALITLAFRLIRANIPATVLGRDIGQGLKSLVAKMNAKSIDDLVRRLENYRTREVNKAMENEDNAKADSISDKVDTLLCIIDVLKEDKRTFEVLDQSIDYLFREKHNSVRLATIHKSKGLESDRVIWLERSRCPSRWAKLPWQIQQEENLCYVAGTRAKNELHTIELEEV